MLLSKLQCTLYYSVQNYIIKGNSDHQSLSCIVCVCVFLSVCLFLISVWSRTWKTKYVAVKQGVCTDGYPWDYTCQLNIVYIYVGKETTISTDKVINIYVNRFNLGNVHSVFSIDPNEKNNRDIRSSRSCRVAFESS